MNRLTYVTLNNIKYSFDIPGDCLTINNLKIFLLNTFNKEEIKYHYDNLILVQNDRIIDNEEFLANLDNNYTVVIKPIECIEHVPTCQKRDNNDSNDTNKAELCNII